MFARNLRRGDARREKEKKKREKKKQRRGKFPGVLTWGPKSGAEEKTGRDENDLGDYGLLRERTVSAAIMRISCYARKFSRDSSLIIVRSTKTQSNDCTT